MFRLGLDTVSGLTALVTSGDQRRHVKVRCDADQVFHFVIEPVVWVRFCLGVLIVSGHPIVLLFDFCDRVPMDRSDVLMPSHY